jgi:NadR type nicotinamide-nucleotide adenylyltransferase
MLRVVLTGPESTGKTELARALATRFDTEWSSEFARDYARARDHRLSRADVDPIAAGQIATEDDVITRARAAGAPLVIHDTDVLSTAIYSQHYYGECPAWIMTAIRARRADLYLLLDAGVPFAPDPVRDIAADRNRMLALFEHSLNDLGAEWTLIAGNWQQREQRAHERIETLLGSPRQRA